ncbi:sulfatase [Aeoliella sp. ICT_H6.2]|uniref:Sulfatase n=1 Tax=Aeoliella straminimaris TaxID=2954799 RepID=A0A9X2JFP3_9BACT|nr:sulfatase [Aeoliella straminimaris]MCO6042613.1 sulfatase [Aeoliella straminimaris]
MSTAVLASTPNIIVIYADDHAQHAISSYGSKINSTPNIDVLAREGMRFTQSFVANSICGPARATLLTGLHSHANGQTSNRAVFRDELPTFAKTLRDNGYATAVVGKWHLSTEPNGFDYWALKKGSFFNPDFETTDGIEHSVGHATDVITTRSLDWIERNSDQPFMIWISHSAAHRTWEPPLRHLNKYANQRIPEPDNLFDDYEGKNSGAETAQMRISRDLFPAYDLKLPATGKGILDGAATAQLARLTPKQREQWDNAFGPRNKAFAEMNLQGDELTRWNYQRYIKNYLRNVDGLDDSVGRICHFLRENNLEENTVVVYTSDQGFFLGDHGWYDKRWMYEESFRTPMIIKWPGVTPPGTVCDLLVQNIDMSPTFLDVAGQEIPDTMHGRSLAPLLRGETPEQWRDAIYYHYQMQEPMARTSHLVAKHYGIRTEKYKLIYFYELDAWELYDMGNDPHEMHNLIGNSEYATVVAGLKQRLAELRTEYGDTTGTSFKEH